MPSGTHTAEGSGMNKFTHIRPRCSDEGRRRAGGGDTESGEDLAVSGRRGSGVALGSGYAFTIVRGMSCQPMSSRRNRLLVSP